MQGQAVNLTPQQVVDGMGGVARVMDELTGEMRTVQLATDRPPLVEHKTSETFLLNMFSNSGTSTLRSC